MDLSKHSILPACCLYLYLQLCSSCHPFLSCEKVLHEGFFEGLGMLELGLFSFDFGINRRQNRCYFILLFLRGTLYRNSTELAFINERDSLSSC
jgi:hypothetical protein